MVEFTSKARTDCTGILLSWKYEVEVERWTIYKTEETYITAR